jgi:hypothetical protein
MGSIGELEKRLEAVERRLAILEDGRGLNGGKPPVVELDLALPEADIDGLRFNETKVHAVFEKKEDGWWHSRDILFMSARNTGDDNSFDILTAYLKLGTVNNAFYQALKKAGIISGENENIEISLPKENEGVKQYNGVDWWYWLEGRIASSAASFARVYGVGGASYYGASAVGGCAPAFCVAV